MYLLFEIPDSVLIVVGIIVVLIIAIIAIIAILVAGIIYQFVTIKQLQWQLNNQNSASILNILNSNKAFI